MVWTVTKTKFKQLLLRLLQAPARESGLFCQDIHAEPIFFSSLHHVSPVIQLTSHSSGNTVQGSNCSTAKLCGVSTEAGEIRGWCWRQWKLISLSSWQKLGLESERLQQTPLAWKGVGAEGQLKRKVGPMRGFSGVIYIPSLFWRRSFVGFYQGF